MLQRSLQSVVLALAAFSGNPLVSDDRVDFFEAKIRPVLVEHCYQCHSADARNIRGGLLLDSKAATQAGGDSGPAVIPGKPDQSLLISALRHESFEMPPGRRLPSHVVSDFETWIRQGAVDPRTGGKLMERTDVDVEAGRNFWSFRPIARHEPPLSPSDGWSVSDIDRFIYQKVATDPDMAIASDAEAHEVYRRLTFGLIGRPPVPDDIAAFTGAWNRNPQQAVEQAVDRLLASSLFGERWGRHWLDAVRFAESSGGGRSLMFPHAWRFRDYVITSFNKDKPFDQLIREHIAGDLLSAENTEQRNERLTGVGYLALGPTNYEQQDKELLRMDVIDEQIDTVGRTFLGMSLGCARCHDHKFDPIPTRDYYALAGIFGSTKTLLPGNVSSYVTNALGTDRTTAQVAAWQAKETEINAAIGQVQRQIGPLSPFEGKSVPARQLDGIVLDDEAAVFAGSWTNSTHTKPFVNSGYRHDNGQKSGRTVRFEFTLRKPARYSVQVSYSHGSNRCQRVVVDVGHAGGTETREIDQRERPDVDGLFHHLGEFEFDSTATVSIDTDRCGPGVVIVDAVRLIERGTADAKPSPQNIAELNDQLKRLQDQLRRHRKNKPDVPVAMGVRDLDQPMDGHLHIRGAVRNLGPRVPRGSLSVIDGISADLRAAFDIPEQASGRRELARWIASPANPLTARVMVNRVWHHLIGEGIVRTPDNFGKTGAAPTHPQLLDYLADRFVHEDNWSVKSLIRRIATSRVYRLSASVTKTADPDNRLLARGFRLRLDAEAIRDAMLVMSGRMDQQTRRGRTIARIAKYDNGYDHSQNPPNLASIFVPAFRNAPLSFFEVFDRANPNLVVGRRNVSTLPSQALFLMNSPFVVSQSQAAGELFLQDSFDTDVSAKSLIDDAVLKVLGRAATDAEHRSLAAILATSEANDPQVWSLVFQALFASMDFRYLD